MDQLGFADKGAAALYPVDPPLPGQGIQCLAHGGTADPQLQGQLIFRGDLTAHGIFSCRDFLPDIFRGLHI